MISLDTAQMKTIYASLAQALKDDSSTDAYAAFSKYLFEQVSCQSVHNSANATLHFERRGLKSLSTYRAMAAAYARQNSATEPQSVTTTNTTLQIRTFRQEPKVHLDEYFASSSKLILYDFYVEDPDSAVRNGYVNVEIYETYDPDDPGANLPVMTQTVGDHRLRRRPREAEPDLQRTGRRQDLYHPGQSTEIRRDPDGK